jgi:hypothetical protein
MAKAKMNPLFEWFSGSIGRMVFRRSHSGDHVASRTPDMSRVKWSPAQVAHREKMKAAFAYARAAVRDPEIRAYYLRLARRKKKNNRPFDMAVSDYCRGNDRFQQRRPNGDGQASQARKPS